MSVPVALANAVADALAPHGLDLTHLPVHGNVLHSLLAGQELTEGDGRWL
jgi:2-furoyl-CoA dehydrogenase large subunit